VVAALKELPDETVIDGEIVALDASGKPVFSLLQNGATDVHFYVFDVLVLSGQDVTGEPLSKRRNPLESKVLPKLPDPVRCSPVLEASLPDLIQSIRAQGLEGLVAKRANSRYEPGQRSGAWMKMRVNRCQEFIIGGYSIGGSTFDAVILGHVVDGKLVYVERTRSGFTPALRAELLRKMKKLEVLQLAGKTARTMGRRADGGQDEGVPVAPPGVESADRVPGLDRGLAFEAQEVCRYVGVRQVSIDSTGVGSGGTRVGGGG
jgi:ATP-dependent DNA ligase